MPCRAMDIVDRSFGLGLRQFRQAVEHVQRFMLPATLVPRCGIDFIQGSPEPPWHRPQWPAWRGNPPASEAEKHLAPTLGGLAHPVLDSQEPLLATAGDANNYKGTELVILAPQAAVNTVHCPAGAWQSHTAERGAQM